MRVSIALVIATLALGQAQRPTFEVATVKPTTVSGPIDTPPGRFIAAGLPLQALIGYAYRVRANQVLGGPGWISTERWEIQAKVPEGVVVPRPSTLEELLTKPDAIALMLQSLLEERFQLRVRRETRELPVFELSVASGGLKMRLAADQGPIVSGTRPEPTPAGPPALIRGRLSILSGWDRKTMEAKAIPLSQIVQVFVNDLGRPVIDLTGLRGLYDLKLEWSPDSLQVVPENGFQAAPPLSTAVQEQLGLRLESTKGPVQVLVVESVQKPLEN